MAKKLAIGLVVSFFLSCFLILGYFYFFVTFPTVELEVTLDSDVKRDLVIKQTSGLVHIEGEERQNIQMIAQKIAGPRLPYFGESALAQIGLLTNPSENTLEITSDAHRTWRGDAKVDMQIMAPPATNVSAELDSGNVNLINLTGNLSVTNHGSGTIVLDRVIGPAIIVVENGELRADIYEENKPFKLDMRSGNMLLNIHTPHPGPIDIALSEGIVVINVKPQINAMLTYNSTGTVTNPLLTGKAEPIPSDGTPVAMQVGQNGAPVSIQAGTADITFAYLSE